jgi:hypothetical protein
MDDLAPAPTHGISDDVGRVRDESFRARKKAVKKTPPAPAPQQETGTENSPDTAPEPDTNHELDLLA